MGELCRLTERLGIRRKYLLLLLLRSPFDACRTWMLASLMKTVFGCLETGDGYRLLKTCTVCGLIGALLFFYNGIIWSVYAAFAAKAEVLVQRLLLQKILTMSQKEADSRTGGEWITGLNSDLQAAFEMMNGNLNMPHAVVAVINTVWSSLLLMGSSPVMFAITWVFFFLHFLINDRMVLRHIPGLKEEAQRAVAQNTAALEPLIAQADAILLYDAGGLLLSQCEKSSLRLQKVNQSIQLRNAAGSMILRLLGCAGYLAMLAVGYELVSRGSMLFSDMVYCFQARGAVLSGMFMLIASVNNIRANAVCVKRVLAMLDKQ